MKKQRINLSKDVWVNIDKPCRCLNCEGTIDATVINHFVYDYFGLKELCVAFQCPECGNVFFGIYQYNVDTDFYQTELYPTKIIADKTLKKVFSDEIKSISPYFVKIYNEAYAAEQKGCFDIVGIGYRRAFEFLIKDYAIHYNKDKAMDIMKMKLLECINEYFPESEVKETLKNTSWIASNFLHYENKHIVIDLKNLKDIINASVDCLRESIKEKNK